MYYCVKINTKKNERKIGAEIITTGNELVKQEIAEFSQKLNITECKKMLMLAKAGKKKGCLIEGMACPGGCIAGAGTNIAIAQAAKAVETFKTEAKDKLPKE